MQAVAVLPDEQAALQLVPRGSLQHASRRVLRS